MNRLHLTVITVALLIIILAAAFMLTTNGKEEYKVINGNEGLIATASFDIVDTEHSGTWTKGTVFVIDKGDKILMRVVDPVQFIKDTEARE